MEKRPHPRRCGRSVVRGVAVLGVRRRQVHVDYVQRAGLYSGRVWDCSSLLGIQDVGLIHVR